MDPYACLPLRGWAKEFPPCPHSADAPPRVRIDGNLVWVRKEDISAELREWHKAALQVNSTKLHMGRPSSSLKLWRVTPEELGVPREWALHYFHESMLAAEDVACWERRAIAPERLEECHIRLCSEPPQDVAVQRTVHQLRTGKPVWDASNSSTRDRARDTDDALPDSIPRGATLVLPCGCGKTVCACACIMAIGERTLWLADMEKLASQAAETIEALCPRLKVVRLYEKPRRGKRARGEDRPEDGDVYVALIQGYYANREQYRLDELDIGLVVIDEAHGIAAPKYSDALLTEFKAHKLLSLTATPHRGNDGLERCIYHLTGGQSFRIPRVFDVVRVDRVLYHPPVEYATEVHFPYGTRQLNFTATTLAMFKDEYREALIMQLAVLGLVHSERQGLVVVRTVEAAHTIARRLNDMLRLAGLPTEAEIPNPKHGKITKVRPDGTLMELDGDDGEPPTVTVPVVAPYTGTWPDKRRMSADDRARGISALMCITTDKMVGKGTDKPIWSYLVLTVPLSDAEQVVGRVLRAHPTKPKPWIIDLCDCWSLFYAIARKRMNMYTEAGFTVFKQYCYPPDIILFNGLDSAVEICKEAGNWWARLRGLTRSRAKMTTAERSQMCYGAIAAEEPAAASGGAAPRPKVSGAALVGGALAKFLKKP